MKIFSFRSLLLLRQDGDEYDDDDDDDGTETRKNLQQLKTCCS